jgi:hypothetical protein
MTARAPTQFDMIEATYRAGKISAEVAASAEMFHHDDYCAILAGAGPCNCSSSMQNSTSEPPEEPTT